MQTCIVSHGCARTCLLMHLPSSALLAPNVVFLLSFLALQYLGGLLDLTGELNRFAVARATERDSVGVKECLETVLVVR